MMTILAVLTGLFLNQGAEAGTTYAIHNPSRGTVGNGFLLEHHGVRMIMTAGHVCAYTTQLVVENAGTYSGFAVGTDVDICVMPAPAKGEAYKLAPQLPILNEKVKIEGFVYDKAKHYPRGVITGWDNWGWMPSDRPKPCGDDPLEQVFLDSCFKKYFVPIFRSSQRGYPGQSGSPLVNIKGEVLGMLVMIDHEQGDRMLAIRVDVLARFADIVIATLIQQKTAEGKVGNK